MTETNSFYKEIKERNEEFFNELSIYSESIISLVNESNNSIEKSFSQLLHDIEKQYKHYICQKCKNFPLIEFINKNEIYYTCDCYKRKNIIINEIFKKENKYLYFENKSNSSTRSNSYISNKALELENEIKVINDNKDIFKCQKHNHKFRYYCEKCNLNICKQCVKQHIFESCEISNFKRNKYKNIIIFDFINPEIESKILKIKDITNQLQEKIDLENLDFDSDDNDDDNYIIKDYDDNMKQKLPKNYLKKFIELIDIIIYDFQKYPNFSHYLNIQNICKFLKIKNMSIIKKNDKNTNNDINNSEYNNNLISLTKIEEEYLSNYDILELIGEGKFTEVFKAKVKNTDEYRAIKIIRKDKMKKYNNGLDIKRIEEEFLNSIKIMENMSSKYTKENTIKYYEYFCSTKKIFIIMELCDDNLLNLIENKSRLVDQEINDIIFQLNNCFIIMKNEKIIHGNIKLENILIKYVNEEKTKFKLKLTDYGKKDYYNNSFLIKSKNEKDVNLLKTMAPQILGDYKNQEKCDLWSLGVIIYYMLFNKYPFEEKKKTNLLKKINNKEKELDLTSKDDLNDLIRNLLNSDQRKRLSWEQYFEHTYIKNIQESENN